MGDGTGRDTMSVREQVFLQKYVSQRVRSQYSLTLTLRLGCCLRGLLSYHSVRLPKYHASPLELSPQPSVPENLYGARLLDYPHQGNLEDAGGDAQLDTRQWGKCEQCIAYPILLLRLLRCQNRLQIERSRCRLSGILDDKLTGLC